MVSLNDINKEADEKYGPFVIDDVPGGEVELRNALRLPPDERDRLAKLNAALKSARDAKDQNKALDVMAELLKLVAVGDSGDRLLEAIEYDATKVAHIISLYKETTMPGEASPSGG